LRPAVILMEGGSKDDLKILDMAPEDLQVEINAQSGGAVDAKKASEAQSTAPPGEESAADIGLKKVRSRLFWKMQFFFLSDIARR